MDLASVVDYSFIAATAAGAAYKWVVFRKDKKAWENERTELTIGVLEMSPRSLVNSSTGRVDPAVVDKIERLGASARGMDVYSIRNNELDARVGLVVSVFGLLLLAPSAYWAVSDPGFYSVFRVTLISVFVAATVKVVLKARSEVRRLIVKDVMES